LRGNRPFADLEQHVLSALESSAPGGVAVACSGGPDSVALLAAAAAVARAAGRDVAALHVNHGVRPAADRDEGVAMAAATHAGAPFHSVLLEPGGPADEAGLRALRYEALTAMARAAGCGTVATAHTLEDQVETVLLAVVRGTGLRGLSGMPGRRPLGANVELIRPVLERRRGELRAYCHARALPYAIDESNEEPRYRRNRLRRLLAELRAVEPSADEAISRLARLAREEDDWLDRQAAEALASSLIEGARLSGGIRTLARPLVRRVLRLWLGGRDLAYEPLDRLADAVMEGRRGRYFVRKGEEVVIREGVLERRAHGDGSSGQSEADGI